MSEPTIEISVIVPVGLRTASASKLIAQYKAALSGTNQTYEFIFVLDGPNVDFANQLRVLVENGEALSVIGLARSFGESSAVMAGLRHARGQIILTLPAYYQIDAAEIPNILQQFAGSDLVVCHRTPRRGGWPEMFRRKSFHWLIKKMTGTAHNDLGCGVRCIDRKVLEELNVYGEQNRFIALLAVKAGFTVKEVAVRQSQEDFNAQGYSVSTYLQSALDLFNIFFLMRFTRRPLRFFGVTGLFLVFTGLLLTAWIVFERLYLGVPLAERPALILSSLSLVLGMQVIAIGLLGELLIFTHAGDMDEFRIASIVEVKE